MKKTVTFAFILFFAFQLSAQTTVTITNNQPNWVLMELGWNDWTVSPALSTFKPHVSDFQCLAPGATLGPINAPFPNLDILKGFKVYCPFAGCAAAQSYTDNGPWSGDPEVAPIWHMGFMQPAGFINHYDCGTNSLIGTIDWSTTPNPCRFPYGDLFIVIN